MATLTPVWTDYVSVIGAQVLARGSTVRGTLDLRGTPNQHMAVLFAKFGRGGTAAISSAVPVIVRPLLNNGAQAVGIVHPVGIERSQGDVAAANSTTVSSDSSSGQAVLTVASGTGFAAGQLICLQDAGGGVTRLEWARISKISGGTITLDRNLVYTHTAAQADTVRNKADVFTEIPVRGGTLYEVIVDYGPQSTGDSLTVQVMAQTLDSYASTE